MKTPITSKREDAVALIIVLAMLVLLSGLIVSFMTTVGNERAASVANNNSVTTRQLADSTVNLVISQIRQATTQTGAQTAPSTWASQPGAIRVYSGKVGTKKTIPAATGRGATAWSYEPGTTDNIYKLYSANDMKVTPASFGSNAWDKKETDVIEQWDRRNPKAEHAEYVDINEPVIVPLPAEATNGADDKVDARYPIIDPRAKFSLGDKVNTSANPGIVDGFDIKVTGLDDPALKNLSGQAIQYLPMPVKWIYIMRDGTMSAADETSGKIVGASAENPIVGRTAFWTDDEACKININTASEGTFWDTPTASSEQESGNVASADGQITSSSNSLSLGASQPVRGEIQRYPGHPATTSLSPVLGWLWGTKFIPTAPPAVVRDPALIAMKEELLQFSPFVPNGRNPKPLGATSMGASINPDPFMPDPPATGAVTVDPRLNIATKRLYATVDELIFRSDRNGGKTVATQTKLNSEKLTPDALEKVRFFLTANSRAPELNLFGRPRITFWPVNHQEEQRTNYDDLFAFTSTLHKDPSGNKALNKSFFMTRYDAKSLTNDYKGKPTNGLDNRNPELYEYLQWLTGSGTIPNIPGFGGNFVNKYTQAERDQILTLIFDYCRCVNLVDTGTRTRAGLFQPYTPFFGKGNSGYHTFAPRSVDWSGQVTPLRTITNTHQGLGRFPTISEAAIVFYRTGTTRPPENLQINMQAALVFEMTTPMPGYPGIRETYHTVVTALRPTLASVDNNGQGEVDIKLVGVADLSGNGEKRINIVNVSSHDVGFGRAFMPDLGFMNQMCWYPEPNGPTDFTKPGAPVPDMNAQAKGKFFAKHASTLNYVRKTTVQSYPYISDPFPAPATYKAADTLKFKAGSFKVEIWSGEAPDDGRKQLVQTIFLDFPPDQVTVPVPLGSTTRAASLDTSIEKRLNGNEGSSATGGWDIFGTGTLNGTAVAFNDAIRSIEFVGVGRDSGGNPIALPAAQTGDLRLGATLATVPAAAYAPRGGLTRYKSTALNIHGLVCSHGDPYTGFLGNTNSGGPAAAPFRGLLAANGTNRSSKPPVLPIDINGVKNSVNGPGDWDRGISKHKSGAFGNKVDEGNVFFDYADGNAIGSKVPYFRGRSIEETGLSYFSPNRQLSSAVMFGSLPTGSVRGKPWQTLLFRPDRGAISHPGAQTATAPADHLLLDLFNLPVIEPYSISEPFSTAGKVNLNFVIAPFGYAKGDTGTRSGITSARSYIRRDTALRGIFKAVKIMAVPTLQGEGAHTESPVNQTKPFRFDIDAEKTLDLFEYRFKNADFGLFRSASEICDMDLYPVTGTYGPSPGVTDWARFWDTDYAQTGDNMRERPYSHIYPRVTTKSNIFTVHMRCQAVQKVPGTAPDKFDPKRDKILGEYRGNSTIERFIDPNDPQLAKYDVKATSSSVDPYYRFRVIGTKQFLPR